MARTRIVRTKGVREALVPNGGSNPFHGLSCWCGAIGSASDL